MRARFEEGIKRFHVSGRSVCCSSCWKKASQDFYTARTDGGQDRDLGRSRQSVLRFLLRTCFYKLSRNPFISVMFGADSFFFFSSSPSVALGIFSRSSSVLSAGHVQWSDGRRRASPTNHVRFSVTRIGVRQRPAILACGVQMQISYHVEKHNSKQLIPPSSLTAGAMHLFRSYMCS